MTRLLSALLLLAAPAAAQPAPAPTATYQVVTIPGPKGDPGPPGKDARRPYATFDPRDFGAKADGQSDDAMPIQAAVDAAQEWAASPETRRAVVDLSGDYRAGSPVHLDGAGVTLRGPGSLRAADFYGGNLITVGVPRLGPAEAAARRVPSALDATAAPGRTGLSSGGAFTLVSSGNSLQLGGQQYQRTNRSPDYWGHPRYTFEGFYGLPDVPPGAQPTLFGSFRGNDPDPVALLYNPAWGYILFARLSDGTNHAAEIRTDQLGPRVGLCLQVDLDDAAAPVSAWVNDKAGQVTLDAGWKPGVRFARPAGDAQWTLLPGPSPAECHGFSVQRGLKYQTGQATQLRRDGQPVTDGNRYFEYLGDPAQESFTAAYLPLDDGPATHVKAQTPYGTETAFWISNDPGRGKAANVAVEDLTVAAQSNTGGAALAIGQTWGLRVERCRLWGGYQGVGSLSLGCSYPVVFRDCSFRGTDVACFGYDWIGAVGDCTFDVIGRHAMLFSGGGLTLKRSPVLAVSGYEQSYIRLLDNGYGATWRIEDQVVDNENWGASVAVLDVDQSPYAPNLLVVDGLSASTLGEGTSLIRLRGRGTTGAYQPAVIRASGLSVVNGAGPTPVRVDGPGWYGTVDASQLNSGVIAGDGGQNIAVVPPAK